MTKSTRHVFYRDPDQLTLTDFCRYTGMSRTKAFMEIATGRLFAIKVANLIVIHQNEIDRWLESTCPTAVSFNPFSARAVENNGNQTQPPF
jgi:hypothetical protein